MSCLQILESKTSFGTALSRLDPWPQPDGEYVVCRLSVGYKDTVERVLKGITEFIDASIY